MSFLPIRCFECGAVIGNKWELYANLIGSNIDSLLPSKMKPQEALDKMKVKKPCCRNVFIATIQYK